MQATELFYPRAEVDIGQYTLKSGIELLVSLRGGTCFARVRFVKQFRQRMDVFPGDEACIRLGYDDCMTEVLTGYVANTFGQSERSDELLLRDATMLLEQTKVGGTFMDATPQDIIRHCLGQAGVAEMRISDRYYPALRRVTISQKSAASAIAEVGSLWSINSPFFFMGGVFYWGAMPEQGKVYHFEHASNIISLTRSRGVWELETVLVPFVRPLERIAVSHPLVSGEVEVKGVVFATNEAGFIRTTITF